MIVATNKGATIVMATILSADGIVTKFIHFIIKGTQFITLSSKISYKIK
jgi:hypothetical protein